MREFTDSSPLAGDMPALRARLAEDGYLFLRGLMPRDAVAAVQRVVVATRIHGKEAGAGKPLPNAAPLRAFLRRALAYADAVKDEMNLFNFATCFNRCVGVGFDFIIHTQAASPYGS